MDRDRYAKLDKEGRGISMKELQEGWHFCEDWDGLLVGPGMPEMECCHCSLHWLIRRAQQGTAQERTGRDE